MSRLVAALAGGMTSTAAWPATVSIDNLLNNVIYLVIVGLIFWVIWWFIAEVGIPEPFNKVARLLLALVAVIVLVGFLLSLTGSLTFR